MKNIDNNIDTYFTELNPEFELSAQEMETFGKIISTHQEVFNEEVENISPRKATLTSLLNTVAQDNTKSNSKVLLFSIPVYKMAAVMLMLLGLSSILNYSLHEHFAPKPFFKVAFDSTFALHNDSNSSNISKPATNHALYADTSFERAGNDLINLEKQTQSAKKEDTKELLIKAPANTSDTPQNKLNISPADRYRKDSI